MNCVLMNETKVVYGCEREISRWCRMKVKNKQMAITPFVHSPTVTCFLVLTMGACLYSALLLRQLRPLSW